MSDWLGDAWRVMPDTFATHLSRGAWQAPKHLQLLGYFLYLAGTQQITRLAIELPPGHGKSELSSHWFPVWTFDYDPRTRLILSSYEATLAEEWGKAVRTTIDANSAELAVRLRVDSQAANRWRTVDGGGMWTVGAGGAITGRRAKVFIIDDPHKNFQEAHSPAIRESVWNWFTSTARTRMLPGGSIVVIQTRWHAEDLIGRLKAGSADDGHRWVSIRLPAIAEEDETIETVLGKDTAEWLRSKGIPLPDWHRAEGEALWPILDTADGPIPWFDLDELEGIKHEVGAYVWEGLYQQRPSSPSGDMFKADRWVTAQSLPPGVRLVRRFDLAATKSASADWTAAVLLGRDQHGTTYVVDVQRIREETAGVEAFMRRVAAEDRRKYGLVPIRLEQEPGSSGKSYAQHVVKNVLYGFLASAHLSTGSKFTRALPLSGQQQQGRVVLVMGKDEAGALQRPEWFDDFMEECQAFDRGAHDDMVDAASLAYLDLAEGLANHRMKTTSARKRQLPEMNIGGA